MSTYSAAGGRWQPRICPRFGAFSAEGALEVDLVERLRTAIGESAQTGLGMSTKTWRTPKRSLRCSPRRLTPNVSVA
jgi:hypothetical protein